MPRIALTRSVSQSLARCELTYLERAPIDLERARGQHAAYEKLLASIGLRVERLPTLDDQPDAVFVEDAALALDELANEPGLVPAAARGVKRERCYARTAASPGTAAKPALLA